MEHSNFIKKLKESDIAFISWMDLPGYTNMVSLQKNMIMAAGIPFICQNGINDPVSQSGCVIVKNETEEIKKGIYQFLSMSELEREKWRKR